MRGWPFEPNRSLRQAAFFTGLRTNFLDISVPETSPPETELIEQAAWGLHSHLRSTWCLWLRFGELSHGCLCQK